MYNTRSSAKNRSANTGKTSHSFKKPGKPRKQAKVKKSSRYLGAANNKDLQEGARKGGLSSQRLTVSPTFFTKGIKSKVARRRTDTEEHILNEDLYSLLQPAEDLLSISTQIRQSREPYNPENPELPKDLLALFNNRTITRECEKSKHFSSLLEELKLNKRKSVTERENEIESETGTESKDATTKSLFQVWNYSNDNCKVIVESNSKSLFKEINQRYDQLLQEGNQARTGSPNGELKIRSSFRNNVISDFNARLKRENKLGYRERAVDKSIRNIQSVLKQLDKAEPPTKMTENRYNKSTEENEENLHLQLVPPSSWVFRTPNDQKLKQAPVEEVVVDLKPAILQMGEDTKVLYEIDETVVKHVNLDNYVGQKRMVPINPNIARPVCEVNIVQEDVHDEKFVHCRNKENWQDYLKNAGISNCNTDDNSFKIPVNKQQQQHHRALRDTTNLVREVTDPKRHGFKLNDVPSSSAVSPYKKDNRTYYTQRPMKTIKKSSRSFKKPPKKLTFEFESKRQKLSLFDTSGSEKSDSFNLDESQEAFNESFTFIKNDTVDMECSLTENYFPKSIGLVTSTVTSNELNPLNMSDMEIDCYDLAPQKTNENERYATNFPASSNLCDSEVSYNLNEQFLTNFSKITETPTFKFYPRRNYDVE